MNKAVFEMSMALADISDCSFIKDPELSSQPLELGEIRRHDCCYFKLLGFGVVSKAAINNHSIL